MAKPKVGDWIKFNRTGMYLKGNGRLVGHFHFEHWDKKIVGLSDMDLARCVNTRKSTSGGIIMKGSHCIRTGSSTQDTVALSSREAEYYGLVKTSRGVIGTKRLFEDMGVMSDMVVCTDASAAKCIASRKGVGRVRHLDTHQLWFQEKVARKEIKVTKVESESNLADI